MRGQIHINSYKQRPKAKVVCWLLFDYPTVSCSSSSYWILRARAKKKMTPEATSRKPATDAIAIPTTSSSDTYSSQCSPRYHQFCPTRHLQHTNTLTQCWYSQQKYGHTFNYRFTYKSLVKQLHISVIEMHNEVTHWYTPTDGSSTWNDVTLAIIKAKICLDFTDALAGQAINTEVSWITHTHCLTGPVVHCTLCKLIACLEFTWVCLIT